MKTKKLHTERIGIVNQIHIKSTGILHHYREISILAEDCCPLLCHQLLRHDRTTKRVVQAEGIAKKPGLKNTGEIGWKQVVTPIDKAILGMILSCHTFVLYVG